MKIRINLLLASLIFLSACSPRLYQPQEKVSYSKYNITPGNHDTSLHQLLAPYSSSVNKTMNEIIGTMAKPLEKKQPDNTLGFFMTDAFLSEGQRIFGTPIDIALVNYGGIRVPLMPAGPISTGAIYEAMPFDNLLILLTLDGKQLQTLLNHVSARGGWPLSGGTYTIKNKSAIDVRINGTPIDPKKQYVVAVSDYIANGGDDCSFLVGLPQQNKGYLQRDALIAYVKQQTSAGKPVEVLNPNRVTIEQ